MVWMEDGLDGHCGLDQEINGIKLGTGILGIMDSNFLPPPSFLCPKSSSRPHWYVRYSRGIGGIPHSAPHSYFNRFLGPYSSLVPWCLSPVGWTMGAGSWSSGLVLRFPSSLPGLGINTRPSPRSRRSTSPSSPVFPIILYPSLSMTLSSLYLPNIPIPIPIPSQTKPIPSSHPDLNTPCSAKPHP
jgi:hypothetical protein